jgi:tetratricopeptide (TPR) repeat protein
MTDREKYRTRASYYVVLGNNQKCIDEYETLIAKYPSDSIALNNLSVCLSQMRNMPKALERVRQAAAIFPKRPGFRLNIALYTLYGSDFEGGEREARATLELDPNYRTGFIASAFAQLGQGQLQKAAEAYGKLEKLSKLGASNAAMGMADIALYEGRFEDAAHILEKAATEDSSGKLPEEAANKFALLAYTRMLQGQNAAAIAAAQKALDNSKAVRIRFSAGRILAATGQTARAKALADDLGKELQSEPQSYGKLIEAEIALKSGDPALAIKLITEGIGLLDTWIARFSLGRAYLERGAFPEADGEFENCLRRRGEALALFLDESPTFGYLPSVYYFLGRTREGMKTANFADSYQTYLTIRGNTNQDPLITEVRKRVGASKQ